MTIAHLHCMKDPRQKKGFSIRYDKIKQMELVKRNLSVHYLKVKREIGKDRFDLTKEQFDQLQSVLMSIPALSGKIEAPE